MLGWSHARKASRPSADGRGLAVEVVAAVQDRYRAALDLDAHEIIDGFGTNAVALAYGEKGGLVPDEVGEALAVVASRDAARCRRGFHTDLVDVLVGEVHEVCPVFGDAVGAAAVFVDPTARVERRRSQLPHRARSMVHQGRASGFLGSGFDPQQGVVRRPELRVSLRPGSHQVRVDWRRPGAVCGCHVNPTRVVDGRPALVVAPGTVDV